MPLPIPLRVASAADAPEIARLSAELGYPVKAERIAATLRSLLDASRYSVVVAPAEDGRLLGWICAERRLSLESGECVEITGLVVSSAARRLGVGRALVGAAERWAAAEGFASLCVRSNVVRAESHAFYQGLGFRHRKTQHVYDKAISG